MPLIVVRGECQQGEGKDGKEIFYKLKVKPGQSPADVDLKRWFWSDVIAADGREDADVIRYFYGGAWKFYRLGDQVLMDEGEYLYIAARFPGVYEMLDVNVRGADETTRTLLAHNRSLARDIEVANAEAEQAKSQSLGLASRAEKAETSAAAMAAENERLKQKIAALESAPPKAASSIPGATPKAK